MLTHLPLKLPFQKITNKAGKSIRRNPSTSYVPSRSAVGLTAQLSAHKPIISLEEARARPNQSSLVAPKDPFPNRKCTALTPGSKGTFKNLATLSNPPK